MYAPKMMLMRDSHHAMFTGIIDNWGKLLREEYGTREWQSINAEMEEAGVKKDAANREEELGYDSHEASGGNQSERDENFGGSSDVFSEAPDCEGPSEDA